MLGLEHPLGETVGVVARPDLDLGLANDRPESRSSVTMCTVQLCEIRRRPGWPGDGCRGLRAAAGSRILSIRPSQRATNSGESSRM